MSGLLGIALAHGLALSIAVNAFGGISGAHFNPAVTSGFLVTGRIAPGMAVNYVVSQLLGATTAAGVCRVIFPADSVAVDAPRVCRCPPRGRRRASSCSPSSS